MRDRGGETAFPVPCGHDGRVFWSHWELGNHLLRRPRGWYHGGGNEGVWHQERSDLILGWKWTALQNQHKAQTRDNFSLASFDVWQVPEQPFPSVTLGALQELVRFSWSCSCPVQTRGTCHTWGMCAGGLPVPSSSSQLSLPPAATTESWNHSGWKRPPRTPRATPNQHWQVPP